MAGKGFKKSEHLRRKGRGITERPVCPHCKRDLKRSYIGGWSEGKRTHKPTGWECVECKFKLWD